MRYRTLRRDPPVFRQYDDESCGFLAALAVARRLVPELTARQVERAVPSGAVDAAMMQRGLRMLGFQAERCDGLDMYDLDDLLRRGWVPLVTVWPDDYACDHWTAVWSVPVGEVQLSNYECEWVSWSKFRAMWFELGDALIVSK